MLGQSGNDRIFGQAGRDDLLGGRGRDVLVGGPGGDVTLDGGRDDDVLRGSSGAHVFTLEAGNDSIHGGRDHDTIQNPFGTGLSGPLMINLAAGVATGPFGHDAIHQVENVNLGWNDPVSIVGTDGQTASTSRAPQTIWFAGAEARISSAPTWATTASSEAQVGIHRRRPRRRHLKGGQGADDILGSNGDDVLDGGPDIDTLQGGSGTDTCTNGELLFSCP